MGTEMGLFSGLSVTITSKYISGRVGANDRISIRLVVP